MIANILPNKFHQKCDWRFLMIIKANNDYRYDRQLVQVFFSYCWLINGTVPLRALTFALMLVDD